MSNNDTKFMLVINHAIILPDVDIFEICPM